MILAPITHPGLPPGLACPPLLPGTLHLDVFPRPDSFRTYSLEPSTCAQASTAHPFLLYWWSQFSIGKTVLKTFLLLSINTKMLKMISFRKLSWIHFGSKRDPNRPMGKETWSLRILGSILLKCLILNMRKWGPERWNDSSRSHSWLAPEPLL